MKTPHRTASKDIASSSSRHASQPADGTMADHGGDGRLPDESWMTDRDSLDGGLPDGPAR